MIGFLKNRARKNAAAKAAGAKSSGDQPPEPGEAGSPDEAAAESGDASADEAATGSLESAIENAATNTPEPPPARYEARENDDGWSVHDRQTDATAETYGYRLARMNRSRAESLVEVLNRGEARRRGRNG